MKLNACVAVPRELVAVNTPENAPSAVGVPLSTPVLALRAIPAGSVPDCTLKVAAGLPLAMRVAEKGAPVRRVVLRAGLVKAGGDSTLTLNACVALPCEFVAAKTPANIPPEVGVPLSAPALALRLRPGGSEPDCTLNVAAGVPLAVSVVE